ncbi:hypothetical protein HDU91_004619 [Kappamyces sp. JEL0680]|nr:hypothetical protein HDU91_004619 [Kappamyces sp. JEL0680]
MGGWSLFQAQGLLLFPSVAPESSLTAVVFAFGIVITSSTHRWGTGWSHRDFQHVSSGLLWTMCGVLAILYQALGCPPKKNPFPFLALFLEGVQMLLHTQHNALSVQIHQLFGSCIILASALQWWQIYSSGVDTTLVVLNNTFWIVAGLLFMGGNSDGITKLSAAGIDAPSFAVFLSSLALAVVGYIFLCSLLFRSLSPVEKQHYDRFSSTDTITEEHSPLADALV